MSARKILESWPDIRGQCKEKFIIHDESSLSIVHTKTDVSSL